MPITRRQSVRTMVESATATPVGPATSANIPAPVIQPEVVTEEQQTATSVPQVGSLPQQLTGLPEQPTHPPRGTTRPPPPKRSKLGWQLRDDLIKQCKQIALDEGIHDYEALEALLEEALAQRNARNSETSFFREKEGSVFDRG